MPWTYWLSIPILVLGILNLIGFAAVYYGKVIVPKHRWEDMRGQLASIQQQLTAMQASAAVPGTRGAALEPGETGERPTASQAPVERSVGAPAPNRPR